MEKHIVVVQVLNLARLKEQNVIQNVKRKSMTAKDLIQRLTELVNERGDNEIYSNGYEIMEVDYNEEYDCFETNV